MWLVSVVMAMVVVMLVVDPLDYGEVSMRPCLQGKTLRKESVALGAADFGGVVTGDGKLDLVSEMVMRRGEE